jgi:hypothetical protein
MSLYCTVRNGARIFVLALLFATQPMLANDEGWDHNLAIYLWGSDISGKTATGQGFDVSFSDIVDNLDMGAMAAYQGRSGKWSFISDLIYVDISNDKRVEVIPPIGGGGFQGAVNADLGLESLVVHAGVGYLLHDDGEGTVTDFVFGARYLDLSSDLTLNFDTSIPEFGPSVRFDLGDSVIDAIVGFKGVIRSGARWYIPWGANVGAGESDLTWQAHVGAGYRASDSVDVILSYRYLKWEFDSGTPIAELDLSGPMLGAIFRF